MAAIIAVFMFTTARAHSVVMGFSGVIWGLSNLLAVSAIAAVTLWPRGFAVALVAALLGAATYSTNLMVWPALVTGAFVMNRRSQAAAFAIVGASVIAASAAFYHRTPGHPAPETRDLAGLATYVAAYLGSPLRRASGSPPHLGPSPVSWPP
jgi:hypothetical protein